MFMAIPYYVIDRIIKNIILIFLLNYNYNFLRNFISFIKNYYNKLDILKRNKFDSKIY